MRRNRTGINGGISSRVRHHLVTRFQVKKEEEEAAPAQHQLSIGVDNKMFGNDRQGNQWNCNGPYGCSGSHDSPRERDRCVTCT